MPDNNSPNSAGAQRLSYEDGNVLVDAPVRLPDLEGVIDEKASTFEVHLKGNVRAKPAPLTPEGEEVEPERRSLRGRRGGRPGRVGHDAEGDDFDAEFEALMVERVRQMRTAGHTATPPRESGRRTRGSWQQTATAVGVIVLAAAIVVAGIVFLAMQ